MSYHDNNNLAINSQSKTNAQGQLAPTGFHYMPDGTLMADSDMPVSVPKIIKSFSLDTKDIREAGETRTLSIFGDNGAGFTLEIKSGANYYNFQTNSFQAAKTNLSNVSLVGSVYNVSVKFPLVAAGAKYDVYLTTEIGTKHAEYNEVRFVDGSIDINSTTGSNSNLIQKVIYQTLDVTVTINGYSPNGTVTGANTTPATIETSRDKSTSKIPFTCVFTTTSTRTLSINKQPVSSDIMSFVTATVGATPVDILGEDIYPTATAVFTGDDVNGAITSGAVVEIDADVAGNVVIGDKITTPVMTDTVNGDFSSGATAITMDAAVATKMAVGDRVTGTTALDDATGDAIFTVASLDSTNVFSLSASAAIDDGTTLSFSSKINRDTTTVASLDPEGEDKQFTMSQAIQFRDNAPLTFYNRRNYRWAMSSTSVDLSKITNGMRQPKATFFASQATIKDYTDAVTIFEGERNAETIENFSISGVDTLSIKPLIVRDGTTKVVTTTIGSSTNPINITFDQQALLAFGGGANAKIFSYGASEINRLTGYDVEFSDLAVALTKVGTTTTASTVGAASTSVAIARRDGIMDGISTVSGIGIDPAVVNPTVASGAGSVTGAGTIVLSAAQELESGIGLTFAGAGTIATITGNIKINNVGNEDVTLRFDLEKFLTMH